jgi:soluble lytic murein transglycosylase
MPQIPTYDNFQEGVNNAPSERVTATLSADKLSTGARQMQELGAAQDKVGVTGSQITADHQDMLNNVRVEDAMNQARQHAQNLAYDPDEGYLALKGSDALNRPGGKALPEEYGGKLRQSINDIGSQLSNPVQQRLFAMRSGDLMTSFQGDVEKHMLDQFNNYGTSVYKGAGDLAAQDAGQIGLSDPAKTQQDIDTIKASQVGLQKFTGMSANETAAKTNELVSGVHATNIDTALANGDVTGAAQYYKKNNNGLVGPELLSTMRNINQKADAYNAMHAVGGALGKYNDAINPTDFSRLSNIVAQGESGNKQLNADGTPVTNVNANGTKDIGVMQVNEKTAPEAAKLAGLPFDADKYQHDEKYNRRLGEAYLTEQLRTFGDVGKAMAAYNAGPDTVKDAMAAAKAANSTDWLSHMPASTQAYVTSKLKTYNGGGGVPQIPTKMDFVNASVSNLGDSPRMEAVAATRENAEKQYDLMIDARKQQADQAQGRVQAELTSNGYNVSQLSPQSQQDMALINRLDPNKATDVQRFARYGASEDKQQTDMPLYNSIVNDPSIVGKMTDAQFQNLQATKMSTQDQKTIGQIRKNYLNGTDDSAATVNLKAVNETLDARLDAIGISPKLMSEANGNGANKKSNQRMLAARKFVMDDIQDQQQQLGRRMTPQEIGDRVDSLFSKSVDFKSALSVVFDGSKNLMEMQPGDVPGKMRDAIKAKFAARGVKNPTDYDVLNVYRRLHADQ